MICLHHCVPICILLSTYMDNKKGSPGYQNRDGLWEWITQGKVSKFLPGGTIYAVPAKFANTLSVDKPECLKSFVVAFVKFSF